MGFEADQQGAADGRGATTNDFTAGAFEGSAARSYEVAEPELGRADRTERHVHTEMAMDENDDDPSAPNASASQSEPANFVDEVRQLGRRVTPEELERRGVRKLRQFTIGDLNELVARTVDRVLAERADDGAAARNTVLERTHVALAERAANDPAFRIELLERRLSKLADALDRSENALADVLDDVDTGLPTARRYVDSLPDNHPLRRREGGRRGSRPLAGRTRSRRLDPTDAEADRVEERRGMLRALADVNRPDGRPHEEGRRRLWADGSAADERAASPDAAAARPQATRPNTSEPTRGSKRDPRADLRDLARRPHDDEHDHGRDDAPSGAASGPSSFDEVRPEDLRLRMDAARPHKGFGWRAGMRWL